MAKRARPLVETMEPDRVAGHPHPRQTTGLIGQDTALAIASRAIREGRPPQALLISGPPGIGKATLAYRIARYLLAYGATDAGPADLSVPPHDPAALQVAAGAHPGLLLLKRGLHPETGKLMSELSVHEVRKLAGFFGMTSGAGGWRIAIVDTTDDMNPHSANALLKLLEEPPARAMLLLLANRPGRVLPTIRSRCRRLELRPLDEDVLTMALADYLPDESVAARAALARLAGGSLGAALELAGSDGAALAQDADMLIDHAAQPDILAVLALGERLSRKTDGLERLGEFLLDALAARIRAKAAHGAALLGCWTALLSRLEERFGRSAGIHLDARLTILGAARDLAQTARRAGSLPGGL